jgi:cell division protein FtsZ
MSNPNSAHAITGPSKPALSLKFFGVGGAGGNVVDYLSAAGFPDVAFIAVNTDTQALENCRAAQRFPLGANSTRGLGTGGDPELGWAAAEKQASELGQLCAGADIVFLAAGLGGGTGTGAAPVLARVAREAGALTLAFAILPFDCEGKRRLHQAHRGLQQLKAAADGVICQPNQRLFNLVDANTSLVETFRISHEFLAQGLRSIWRLLTRPGLINVDFAHLCAILHGRHAESTLATANALGPNRSREVVEKLLASPLLEEGQLLVQADTVLVSLAGGGDLTMSEVNRVMEQINRRCENAHLVLGATIDDSLGDRLEVTLITSSRSSVQADRQPAPVPELAPKLADSQDAMPGLEPQGPPQDFATLPRPAPRFLPPPPNLSPERLEELRKQQTGANSSLGKVWPRLRQGQLPLEIVSKGRFEKNEPTIHRGEDLDLPTYIRRGIPLN